MDQQNSGPVWGARRLTRTLGWYGACVLAVVVLTAGCHRHRACITAVPLSPQNRCEPEGIPYYLPKPLLVVAKNVRHIDESKIGLTNPPPIPNAFDNQAAYADLKANITVPGGASSVAAANVAAPGLPGTFDANQTSLPDIRETMIPDQRIQDGVAPDCFYTYQIIFVPDLSQKYGLRVKGGPGEIRAAMNLVNGWMYTGMGPFYVKDSSTAQNLMSVGVGALYAGRGVADVLNQVGEIARTTSTGGRGFDTEHRRSIDADEVVDRYAKLAEVLGAQTLVRQTMLNYAEVSIYEPCIGADGTCEWRLIVHHCFDREFFHPSLSKDASMLLERIIETDQQQIQLDMKREEHRARQMQGAPPAAPRADPAQDGGLPPEDLPPGFGASLDATVDDFQRSILNLPPRAPVSGTRSPSASSGESLVTVNVHPADPRVEECETNVARIRLPNLWRHRERPQQTTRIGSLSEATFAPATLTAFPAHPASPAHDQDSEDF